MWLPERMLGITTLHYQVDMIIERRRGTADFHKCLLQSNYNFKLILKSFTLQLHLW